MSEVNNDNGGGNVSDLIKVAHERLDAQFQEAQSTGVHGKMLIEVQFVGGKPIAVKDCLERTHRARTS